MKVFIYLELIHVSVNFFLKLQIVDSVKILLWCDRKSKEVDEGCVLHVDILPAIHFQRKIGCFKLTGMVILLNLKDIVEPLNVLHEKIVVGVIFRNLMTMSGLCFHRMVIGIFII